MECLEWYRCSSMAQGLNISLITSLPLVRLTVFCLKKEMSK